MEKMDIKTEVSKDEVQNQTQNDLKTTEYNGMSTYENSVDVYNIPLPDNDYNNANSVSNKTDIDLNCKNEDETPSENTDIIENAPVAQDNQNNSCEEQVVQIEQNSESDNLISINEQVIVSTVNDENLNETNKTETQTSDVDSSVSQINTTTEESLNQIVIETDKFNSHAFITEIDESVSLPPAEPLILENVDINLQSTEEVAEVQVGSVEETLTTDNEQSTIASSSNSEIQYTVLPPGENSLYQEDGTLIVEYPIQNELNPTEDKTQETETSNETSMEIMEYNESEDDPGMVSTEVKLDKPAHKPKGRKSTGNIPLHILGHNMDKPAEEVPNGKPTPKPRLGVKIPYRNLASQIVSNSELQQQIVERARLKQETQGQADVSNSFAKKLTHRLAQSLSGLSKVTLTPKESTDVQDVPTKMNETNTETTEEVGSSNSENITTIEENIVETVEIDHLIEKSNISDISEKVEQTENKTNSLNIESDSDLIAILEGDGEETSAIINVTKPQTQIVSSQDESSEMKEIEKEISLSEQKIVQPTIPQVKEKKFFKTRESRVSNTASTTAKEKTQLTKDVDTTKDVVKSSPQIKEVDKNQNKQNEVKVAPKAIVEESSTSNSKSTTKSLEDKKNNSKDKDKNTLTTKEKNTGSFVDVEPQLKPAMVLKTYTRKRKSNDAPVPSEPMKKPLIRTPTAEPDPKIDCIPPNAYVTKSSRVIKKKVIWDPDEAPTSARTPNKSVSKAETTPKGTTTKTVPKATLTKTTEKKIPDKEKQTEVTPQSSKVADTKISQDEDEEEKVTPEKQVQKKGEKIEMKKVKTPVSTPSPSTSNMVKNPASAGKSPKRSGKRLTEIDKLLMDEGAVNMLYDINNSDDQKRRGSSRASVTSNDKASNQKELLNRTIEIKNELTQNTVIETSTPKALRKKEVTPVSKKEKESKEMIFPTTTRKMSKDSTKSHSPPPSPLSFSAAEASRIIRRHSSSSFSDNDALTLESMADIEDMEKGKQIKKRIPELRNIVSEENSTGKPVKERVKKKFATPEVTPRKKLKKEHPPPEVEEPRKPVEITIKSEPGNVTGDIKTDPAKSFTVIKMNKHFMINLTYSGSDNYFSIELLKELTVTINELARTKNCNVVSLHSQGPSFCLGIDYKGLVETSADLRRKRATEMSNCIRDFLKCLLHFPKVLVAGIKGDCVGFGVTMLPLFDMIIATDSASFSTPYGKLGCAPEAGFLLTQPYQANQGLASELLYTTQRTTADDAHKKGFVTRLFWPEKFDDEFRKLLAHISNLSKVGLMSTKKQLRLPHCQNTEAALKTNCKVLIDQWISEECQNNFKNYNALTFDIDQ